MSDVSDTGSPNMAQAVDRATSAGAGQPVAGPGELVERASGGAEAATRGEQGPVEVAEAWLAGLANKLAVPASDVQDHLLDLWGVLDDGPARVEVERWLTETLGRNLYSVSDINDRLESLLPSA
ncbi:MAG: hypothetical protein ACP5VR_02095 [Acidimicrobiales bacterium]